MDPALHSPVGDGFRSTPGPVEAKCTGTSSVTARFPGPVAALAAQFDSVAMLSAHSPRKEAAVLGPFEVADYKPGSYVLLRRNPNYWKRDSGGEKPALSGFHTPRDPAEPRAGAASFPARGTGHRQQTRSGHVRAALVRDAATRWWMPGHRSIGKLCSLIELASSPLPDYKRRWFRSGRIPAGHFRCNSSRRSGSSGLSRARAGRPWARFRSPTISG